MCFGLKKSWVFVFAFTNKSKNQAGLYRIKVAKKVLEQ